MGNNSTTLEWYIQASKGNFIIINNIFLGGSSGTSSNFTNISQKAMALKH